MPMPEVVQLLFPYISTGKLKINQYFKANSVEPDQMLHLQHLIWVYTIWKCPGFNPVELQRLKYWWFVYHGYLELFLESLTKTTQNCRHNFIWDNFRWFSFLYILKVCCVYSLGSPQWGDSDKNTLHTFMLEKLADILIMPPVLALWLTLISSNYPCLKQLFMVQRCSSHWSSTVG